MRDRLAAVARDVAEQHRGAIGVELEDVVEVPAGGEARGGSVGHGERHVGVRGRDGGEKGGLEVADVVDELGALGRQAAGAPAAQVGVDGHGCGERGEADEDA